MLPRVSRLRADATHRLVPALHADRDESVLNRLTGDPRDLNALFELEGATNERLLGEAGLLPGITVRELVFGISYAHIVNAAFIHAHPHGSRFNGPERGAWYAGFSLETSSREVAFHKTRELQEIDWPGQETFAFVDFQADFRGDFHDIRGDARFKGCLEPESYAASQRLAAGLLEAGSAGIVYTSVRHRGGSCIACFRPALVNNVRKGARVSIAFAGGASVPPQIRVLRGRA